MNNGFIKLLNQMRVEGSQILNDRLCEIVEPSDISKWSEVIFSNPQVYNEFCDGLINKLIKTQLEIKLHTNKFDVFEGNEMPNGFSIEHAYTNPAVAIDYDPNDLAGILAKYTADTKVEYFKINFDKQFRVTVYYDDLRKAMFSLDTLSKYITNLTQSLYNGASICMKRRTIGIISSAYNNNRVNIKTVSAISDKATAEAFLVEARKYYLNFQEEGNEFNSYKLCGGAGAPVTTWTNPEDIYIIIKNDVLAELSVKELANVFKIDEAKLLGKIIGVKDFNYYNNEGEVIQVNDDLFAFMCDKAFFDIHKQAMYLTSQANGSARCTQYFLNVIKSYNMSVFANGVAFAKDTPEIPATAIAFRDENPSVKNGKTKKLEIVTTPVGATSTITYTSSDTGVATVEKVDDRHVKVTGVRAGTTTLTATDGTVSGTVTLTVLPTKLVTDLDFGISELTLDTTETLVLTITPEDSDENIEFESSNEEVFTVTKVDNTSVTLTEVGPGSATLYAKSKNATAIVTVTVAD